MPSGFSGKRVLLLQGPVGPYFRWLAEELRDQGAIVFKINFNGGDALFYPNGINYRGRMEDIPEYVSRFVDELRIDTIMLFGDCRPVHDRIHALVAKKGLDLRVFEEGYLRPDYITCEQYGVNGYSAIPRSARFYKERPSAKEPAAQPVGKTYWHMAAWAVLYYAASLIARPMFAHYEHHRPLSAMEGLRWIRGAARKLWYAFKERGVQERLTGELSKRFYIVPLQVHNDSQVTVHSRFDRVSDFIEAVVASFAAHAPEDTFLVLTSSPA